MIAYNLPMTYFYRILSIVWAIIIFRLTTAPNLSVSQDSLIQQIVMIGGHVFFFGIQAIWLYLSLPSSIDHLPAGKASRPSIMPMVSIATTSLYGLAIELIQRNIPGRSADPVDWLLDTLGAITFIWFMRRYIHRLKFVK